MADKNLDVIIDVETEEDYIKACADAAISEASGKLCKPILPRQFGELYPAYHRRVMAHLTNEAVACQQYVDNAVAMAKTVAKEKFKKGVDK